MSLRISQTGPTQAGILMHTDNTGSDKFQKPCPLSRESTAGEASTKEWPHLATISVTLSKSLESKKGLSVFSTSLKLQAGIHRLHVPLPPLQCTDMSGFWVKKQNCMLQDTNRASFDRACRY